MATTYAITIGDGSTNPITVTHSLNTRDLVYNITDLLTNDVVTVDVELTSVNVMTLTFASAPSTNQYRVSISSLSGVASSASPTGYSLSNTNSWNMTESQIINRAMRIVGAVGTGDTPNSNEYSDARLALNGLIQGLINEGVGLFKRSWNTRTFNTLSTVRHNDVSYYCIKPHTSSSDSEPNVGTNWQEYWDIGENSTTSWDISGASYTASNQFTFENNIVDIEKMFARDNGYDYAMTKISLDEFFELGSKSSYTTTYPTHFAIEKKLNDSIVHLYPVPVVNTDVQMHYLSTERYFDSDDSTDNIDFPTQWLEAITYLLATRLADEYHVDLSERGFLINKAEELKRRAQGKDSRDFSNSFVSPHYNYFSRRF